MGLREPLLRQMLDPDMQDQMSEEQKKYLAQKLLKANKLRQERGHDPVSGEEIPGALDRWGDEYAQTKAFDMMQSEKREAIADQEKADAQLAAEKQRKALQQAGLGSPEIFQSLGISEPQSAPQRAPATTPEPAPMAAAAGSPRSAGAGGGGRGLNPSGILGQLKAATERANALSQQDADRIRGRISDIEKMATGQNKQQKIAQAMAVAGDLFTRGEGQNFLGAVKQFDANVLSPKEKIKLLQRAERDLTASKAAIPEREMSMLKQQLGYEMGMAKIQATKEAALNKAVKGKTLPAGQAEQIAQLKTQRSNLDQLFKGWEKGVGSRNWRSGVSQYIPGTDASTYDAKRKLKAQEIGVALEGGKLTDVDYTKYIGFLPDMNDTADEAKSKIADLKSMLEGKHNQLLQTFGQTGYDVSRLGAIGGQVIPGTATAQYTPEQRRQMWNDYQRKKALQ